MRGSDPDLEYHIEPLTGSKNWLLPRAVREMLTWATRFDDTGCEAKHLVIAQLVDRIKIRS